MQSARLTNTLLLAVAGLGLVGGATAWFAGSQNQAEWIWAGATVPVLVVVLAGMVRALFRGDVGVDLIAALSMTGALLLGEELAGVVIAMMVSGGGALEDFAQNRARRELTRLLARARRVPIAIRTARSFRCHSPTSGRATGCWCGLARSYPLTVW